MKLIQTETLRGESPEEIAKRIRKDALSLSSHHIELGKMVAVLDEKRDESKHKTLKKFIASLVTDEHGKPLQLESASYKVAKAFSIVGEGHGTVTEAEFDKCRLKWLLTVSAIVGFLAEVEETAAAQFREEMAKAIRTASPETQAVLDRIKDAIKPAPTPGEGEGKGEGETPENVTAMPVELDGALMRSLRDLVLRTDDPAKLETAIKGFRALAHVAIGKLRDVRETAPAVVAVAA